MMPKERLTKSKARIKKYGEVFTPEWVVKMMVDELEKSNEPLPIEATVLEPSCGEGAFLKEVLHRKLAKAKDLHDTIAAVRSVYGVELLPDNAEICRRNLFDIWCAAAGQYEPTEADAENVKAILRRNIACGDFLKKQHADGTPILFLKED